MRTRLTLVVLALAISLALPTPAALGWWARGHENVVDASIPVLPPDLPAFFAKGAPLLRVSVIDPDWWAHKALPELRSAESPNHFIDLELLKGRELPANREGYFKLCAELGVDPFKAGFLPYSAVEWYDRLVLAFAEYRKNPESKEIQAKVLYIAGVLCHYTADSTQPLHATVDFDGRVRPDGSSPRSGIHDKVDALFLPAPELPRDLKIVPTRDFFATMVATMKDSYSLVPRVYELEGKLPNPLDPGQVKPAPEVRDFARERFAAAVKLTVSAWYSAWLQSKDIEVPDWRTVNEEHK